MKKNNLLYIVFPLLTFISCSDAFLDIKPDRKLVVPQSKQDLRALLEYTTVMELSPFMGEIASDDIYIEYARWQTLPRGFQRNSYIWADNLYEGSSTVHDWNNSYEQVFYSNVSIEGLEKLMVESGEDLELKTLLGTGYFFRARAFFNLAQVFCSVYDKDNSQTMLGIPLRLESDITLKTTRSTVEESYQRILADFKKSLELLPIDQDIKTRPTKASAHAYISKTYLTMGCFEEALKHADACLLYNDVITDFNDIDITNNFPFSRFNEEVIFHVMLPYASPFTPTRMNVSAELYEKYSENDLRKKAFFYNNNGTNTFKGSYDGTSTLFAGIATNEMYLIKAECHARLGDLGMASSVLNSLLIKRWKKGEYDTIDVNDPNLLDRILVERRKELVFRGLRWSDLKRLNKEERFAKIITRRWEGVDSVYELLPDSRKYIFPIPDLVIELSGIEQN